MAFSFAGPLGQGRQQGFQLGQGGAAPAALPTAAVPDLAALLQGGGGVDIGSIVALLQGLVPDGGGFGLTGPVQQASPHLPSRSRTANTAPPPEAHGQPPSRSRTANQPSGDTGFPKSGSSTSVFQAPLQGGTLSRAQEIARLVGGTVGTQGNQASPADTDPTLFSRVNSTITIDGKVFTFNQLEIALQDRGTAGLANMLALEGGITNQFTNDNATAGSFGRFS